MCTQQTTKHKTDCKMAFGRKDITCPRCQELLAGAKPVVWASSLRAKNDARLLEEIRAHKCSTSNCGPVCTFGDW